MPWNKAKSFKSEFDRVEKQSLKPEAPQDMSDECALLLRHCIVWF